MIKLLEDDATIIISKKEGEQIKGLYSTKGPDGLSYHELPEEETIIFSGLPSLIGLLEQNRILQIHMEEGCLVGYVGKLKTESAYCEKKYLEVAIESREKDYDRLLVELELESKKGYATDTSEVVEFKKIYKGEKRYE